MANVSTATLFVEKISDLPGDVNCDGTVDNADVTALVYYMLGLQPCKNPKNADLNGDTLVTLADLTALVNALPH
jgi:hypothetical protein